MTESPILWVGLVVVAYVAFELASDVIKRRRSVRNVGGTWGQEFRNDRSGRDLGGWYRALPEPGPAEYRVDDKTWADLGIDEVLTWFDHTLTALGAQTLYRWLRCPILGVTGPHRRLVWAETIGRSETRAPLIKRLIALDDREGWDAGFVLSHRGPELHAPLWVYDALAIALVPMWMGAVLTQNIVLLIAACLVGAINPMLHYFANRKTAGFVDSLRYIRRAIATARELATTLGRDAASDRAALMADIDVASKAILLESAATSDRSATASGTLLELLAEYRRAFFLTDVRAYLRTVTGLEQNREVVTRVLEFVGRVDAGLSLAYLLAHDPRLREATRAAKACSLAFAEVVHPLVDDGVANDLDLGPRSLLVTGSNMAGKSTFLRCVGVNVLLAQAVGVACARSLTCPPLRVFASMEARDDLEASISLYQAEVLRIHALLGEATADPPCLFLVDEAFRGTNPSERIAASGAVLLELAARNLVVAATHDLALAEITQDRFDVGHFTEHVADDKVVFDYRLRPGLSRRTNALALLARLGYPDAVVAHAEAIARTFAAPDMARSRHPVAAERA